MPRRSHKLQPDTPYRVSNEAADDRLLFADTADYERGVFQLFAANFGRAKMHITEKEVSAAAHTLLGEEEAPASYTTSNLLMEEHPPLVYLLAFALLPQGFEFIIIPRGAGEGPRFMQKFGTSITRYRNKRAGRRGALFAGRFSAEKLARGEPVKEAIGNIHERVHNTEHADLRWSSVPDYAGERSSYLIPPQQITAMYGVNRFNHNNYQETSEDFAIAAD